MIPRKQRQDRTKAQHRSRILTAAQGLHRRHGADAISIRGISTAIGLSPMAIYRHFRDKDEVLEGLAEAAYRTLFAYFTGIERLRSPVARVRFVMRRYLDFALDHPSQYEAFSLPRRLRRRYPHDFAARPASSFELLRTELARGMEAGAFRQDDSLEVALTLWAHAYGLLELYRGGRFAAEGQDFRTLYHRSVERLLRGLVVARPATGAARQRKRTRR